MPFMSLKGGKVRIDNITIGTYVNVPQFPVWNPDVWLDSNLLLGDHVTKANSVALILLFV